MKHLSFFLLSLLFLSTLISPQNPFLFVEKAHAQTAPFIPFGGRSLFVVPCTCTPGFFLVGVGLPRPGAFMYGPNTLLYSQYNIFPPAWQLGRALPTTIPCLVYTGSGCVPVGVGFPVVQVGTSLL
jgi:hypothetical protein